MEDVWLEIVLIAAAILVNAFFAGSEIALVSAREPRLTHLRDQGVKGADAALTLKKDPEGFLATIQVGITLVGTLAGAVGGAAAVEAVWPWLRELPVPGIHRWGEPVVLGLTILVITYVSLVIGELTPKSLALRDPERLACRVARPIQGLVRIAAWPSLVLTRSTRAILALLGKREAPTAPLVSEEEVKYLIRQGAAHGVFERGETELVHRVFQFTDTTVRAIMVPRPRILALDVATPPDQVLARAVEYSRTRIPVYRDSLDSILGMVIIKDLLRSAAQGGPIALERMLHPVLFVPETAPVSQVLREFQRQRRNLAVVVDEYGHVAGLATTEDLLEEIVGEIREEREAPDVQGVSRLPDGAYLVDGLVTVRDLRERVGIPIEESPEYQTIAGFILDRLQALPRAGVSVSAFGYEWTVVDLDGPRIAKVKARPEARAA